MVISLENNFIQMEQYYLHKLIEQANTDGAVHNFIEQAPSGIVVWFATF